MQDDHANGPSIEQLRAEYDNADKLAQEVQKLRREAGIAAVNELRYAGFHLLNYTSNENPSDAELTRAINHAKRASYEASEGGILVSLKIIKLFQKQFENTVIEPHVKDWTKKIRKCDEVVKSLPRMRSEDEHEPHDHAAAMKAYRELSEIASETDYARPELAKIIAAERRNTRLVLLGLAVALGAVAVSVLLFVMPYYIGTPTSSPSTVAPSMSSTP